MSGDGWTIDELARHATDALVAAGVGSPNGRVTAAPDRRTIRWYATIGLVDPPLRARGRTARYGERHLLQLLAIKRRQAEGRSLNEIQAELAGATDTTLRRIAGAAGPVASTAEPEPAAPRSRFWAERPPAPQPPTQPTVAQPPAQPTVAQPPAQPTVAQPQVAQPQVARPEVAQPEVARPEVARRQVAELPAIPGPVYPIVLHPAATLHVPAPPTADDLAAIHAAAGALLDALAARGLLSRLEEEPT